MGTCLFLSVVLACLIRGRNAYEPAIARTNYGPVLSYQKDIARVFLGVPFVPPPVTELRCKLINITIHLRNHRFMLLDGILRYLLLDRRPKFSAAMRHATRTVSSNSGVLST